MGRCRITSPDSGPGAPAGITTDTTKIRTARTRICSRRGISTATSLRYRCDSPFKERRRKEGKNMKKACLGVTIITVLCIAVSLVHGQDTAAGEKPFKAKFAVCTVGKAAGKPAINSPCTKGMREEQIEKVITA